MAKKGNPIRCGQMTLDNSFRAISAAVIELAVTEARRGNISAIDFLIRDGGGVYADILGIHPDRIRRWAQSGFVQGGGR
jgi:hypothetical protein